MKLKDLPFTKAALKKADAAFLIEERVHKELDELNKDLARAKTGVSIVLKKHDLNGQRLSFYKKLDWAGARNPQIVCNILFEEDGIAVGGHVGKKKYHAGQIDYIVKQAFTVLAENLNLMEISGFAHKELNRPVKKQPVKAKRKPA